jgi:hypothetical protein
MTRIENPFYVVLFWDENEVIPAHEVVNRPKFETAREAYWWALAEHRERDIKEIVQVSLVGMGAINLENKLVRFQPSTVGVK